MSDLFYHPYLLLLWSSKNFLFNIVYFRSRVSTGFFFLYHLLVSSLCLCFLLKSEHIKHMYNNCVKNSYLQMPASPWWLRLLLVEWFSPMGSYSSWQFQQVNAVVGFLYCILKEFLALAGLFCSFAICCFSQGNLLCHRFSF